MMNMNQSKSFGLIFNPNLNSSGSYGRGRFKCRRRLQQRQRLPVELELNILAWLPVKALLRCRSVCKCWDEEIKSSHFIHLYYTHRIPNPNTCENNQVILLSRESSNLFSIDFSCKEKEKVNSFPVAVQHSLPTNTSPFSFKNFISACNGLLCFRDLSQILVYNPATKSSKFIPLPFKIILTDYFGFGYDSITQDYKILHISCRSLQSTIFSLKKNNSLSISFIEPFPFASKTRWGGSMVSFNNALHWVPALNKYHALISCLDLGTHKYYELPLPSDDMVLWDLVDLRGCLHLSHYARPKIHVWIMKVYGIKESWTKLFCLSHDQVHTSIVPLPISTIGGLCLSKPYAYSKDGRQVIVGVGKRPKAFLCIDLCTQKLRKIKIGGLSDDWPGQFLAKPWVASLVSSNN